MGSFTELTLAVTFAADTPVEVLAAFSEWRAGDGAPELPSLEDLMGEDLFEADDYLWNSFQGDPMDGLSLIQCGAVWRFLMNWGENAYFPGYPATELRWEPHSQHWNLTTRTLPKEGGEWVRWLVGPLGAWAINGSREEPWFAGYVWDERCTSPVLVWSDGRQPFRFEGEFVEK